MCCTGEIRLNLVLRESNGCRLHLVAMLCLFVVAMLLAGHFLIDAISPSATSLIGLHLHGGFPLPAAITINTLLVWAFPVTARSIRLNGWIEPPTTPPPLPLH